MQISLSEVMGNNLRHSIDVANTEIGAIFGLQDKFSLRKIIQISVCENRILRPR